ncbi:MAG: hypothetical protein ACE5I7_09210 [Candidatus Binatia bacterium]
MAETTGLLPALSRRSVLRYMAVSAGLLALSRLRPAAALAAPPVAAVGLQVLTGRQAQVLAAVIERMVFTGGDGMPAVRDTRAVATIDQALLQLAPSVQSQFRWLLVAFEWGPPLLEGKLNTFTGMLPRGRDDYIRSWATSRLRIRRLGFRALKNLSMLGYYSQDATWKGIHYDGPWVARPRRVLNAQL